MTSGICKGKFGQALSLIDTPGLCHSNQHKVVDDLAKILSLKSTWLCVVVMAVPDADACVDVGARVAETLVDRLGKSTHVILCGTKVQFRKC